VSEGVHYCSSFYNGIFGADIYFVRFMSSAGLHIMLSGACGILIFRKRKFLDWSDPFDSLLTLIAIMLVPIFLHGLFNTVLKVELDWLAIVVWLASFAWLAWLINESRKKENVSPIPVAAAPKLVRTEKGTRFVAR
jgi:RsiW-degrading membrane proteinase PrsW (M82 family)